MEEKERKRERKATQKGESLGLVAAGWDNEVNAYRGVAGFTAHPPCFVPIIFFGGQDTHTHTLTRLFSAGMLMLLRTKRVRYCSLLPRSQRCKKSNSVGTSNCCSCCPLGRVMAERLCVSCSERVKRLRRALAAVWPDVVLAVCKSCIQPGTMDKSTAIPDASSCCCGCCCGCC